MHKFVLKLTKAELNQLETYIEWAKREGSYYAPKDQWDKREQHIEQLIKEALNDTTDSRGGDSSQ